MSVPAFAGQSERGGRESRVLASRRSTHVSLRDGAPISIRPIRPDDMGIELAFLRGLSRETRYQRLLSSRDLLPGELRRLTQIDYLRIAGTGDDSRAGRDDPAGDERRVVRDPHKRRACTVEKDCNRAQDRCGMIGLSATELRRTRG